MKKFSFSLDKVLNFKSQVESNLKSEHAQILAAVAKTEARIRELEEEFAARSEEFETMQAKGCSVNELLTYELYFNKIRKQIEEEQKKLLQLREKEELKRQEVIRARVETASIEKLKEKKQQEYNKEVQKSDSLFVEEFVSNRTSSAHSAV